MNYVDSSRKIPPVLIFHGTNDELVPFGQSCMLYDRLVQCGKTATFYAIDNAHHGGREFWSNQVFDIIEDFIKRVVLTYTPEIENINLHIINLLIKYLDLEDKHYV